MDQLVGLREYSRHRGVTLSNVQYYIDNGVLDTAVIFKSDRKKIKVDVADKLLDEYLTASDNHNIKNNTNAQNPDSSVGRLTTAKAIKESYAAKMAQMNYELKSGLLCRSDEVEKSAFDTARLVRDSIMNLSNKLAPILAAENNVDKIFNLLTKEMHDALEHLSNGELNEQE